MDLNPKSLNKLVLWGVGTSRTIRPHWAMHELGLDYETRPIGARTGETQHESYSSINARRKVPLLQDGKLTIGESAAIVIYLSNNYSSERNSLLPQSPINYAKCLEWCFFIVAELDSAGLYVMRRHSANGLGSTYGVNDDVVAVAERYFREHLLHVDDALSDGRLFLMGDKFSAPDILLTTVLDWAVNIGVEICTSAYPYLDRVRSRPAYSRAQESNIQSSVLFINK